MENNNFYLSSFTKSELVEIIKPIIINANQELISTLPQKILQEELFNFEDLCEFLKRSGPTTREAIIGYGIPPHVFKIEANPHYLKSEVIANIKLAPTSKWYDERRNDFLKRINYLR